MPTDDRHDVFSDPQRVRAMAHPTRLRLIDFLGTVSEATATECAEHVGESVASCSFHLRMLAKYGFIERAPARGREKPWRLISRTQSATPDLDNPESIQALSALGLTYLDHQVGLMRAWIERGARRVEPEWLLATTQTGSSMWLTREELAEVSDTIQGIAARFAGRWEDPSTRPPGSRPIRMFAMTFPDPDTTTTGEPAEENDR